MSVDFDWKYDPTIRSWVLGEWDESGQLGGNAFATFTLSALMAAAPRARRAVAENAVKHTGVPFPAHAFDGEPGSYVTMTCPNCWDTSWNADAVRDRRCPTCGYQEGAHAPESAAADG